LANELIKELEEMDVEVLGHEGITQGDKDFVPLLTKIKSLAPDAMYFAGMFPEGALLIKQRAEVGLPALFMGGDGLFDHVLIDLATPRAAEGAYLTTIGSDIRQMPTAQEFVKTYEDKFGPIGAYSAYAYEATSIAIWAIQQAGKKDRAAVLAAMKLLKDYPGLFGPQSFDEKGDSRIHDIGIFAVKDGTFTFVKTATWD
jgi:branched-chain amino acid transport system substrate-binding protein